VALLKPRNRSVVFRLTQEEYDSLRAACIRSGGRSLSDFARTSLLEAIADRRTTSTDLAALEAKLDETQSTLQSLVLLVARIIRP
jgi:hypothetical protein